MPVTAALCAQCNAGAKYSCPRCSAKTCSAACSAAHKSAANCSGERDKTAYVSREQYTYLNLAEDYRFLESLARKFDDTKKEAPRPAKRRKIVARNGKEVTRDPLLPLKKAAVSSGIKLVLLAEGMERRKANKTRLVKKGKDAQLGWTVTWSFRNVSPAKPALSEPPLQHKTHNNASSSPLAELLLRLALDAKLPANAKAMVKSSNLVHSADSNSSLVFLLPVPALAEPPTRSAKHVLERIEKRPAPPPLINKTFEPLPQHRKRMIGSIVAHSSLPSKPGVYRPGSNLFTPNDAPRPTSDNAGIAKGKSMLASAKRYWRLSSAKPLGAALSGCTVVEWPEIEVWCCEDFDRAQRLGYIEVVKRDSDEPSALPTKPPVIKRILAKPVAEPPTSFAGLMGYGENNSDGEDEDEAEDGEVEESGSLVGVMQNGA